MHLTPCLSSSILLVLLLHLLLQAILLETVTVWHSKPGIFRAEAAEAAELLRHFIAQRHPPVQEGCCTLKDEAEPHKKVAIAGLARYIQKRCSCQKLILVRNDTIWIHSIWYMIVPNVISSYHLERLRDRTLKKEFEAADILTISQSFKV